MIQFNTVFCFFSCFPALEVPGQPPHTSLTSSNQKAAQKQPELLAAPSQTGHTGQTGHAHLPWGSLTELCTELVQGRKKKKKKEESTVPMLCK